MAPPVPPHREVRQGIPFTSILSKISLGAFFLKSMPPNSIYRHGRKHPVLLRLARAPQSIGVRFGSRSVHRECSEIHRSAFTDHVNGMPSREACRKECHWVLNRLLTTRMIGIRISRITETTSGIVASSSRLVDARVIMPSGIAAFARVMSLCSQWCRPFLW